MSSPRITIKESSFNSKHKENLLCVFPQNFNMSTESISDNIVYMASEISQLIAKLLLDSTVYAEILRLFKISAKHSIQFLQIIIAENLSNEDFNLGKKFKNSLYNFFTQENFSSINFLSPSSSKLCGLDEYLTVPLKNLTVHGADLIGKSMKPLTPQILLSTPSEMFWDSVPFPKRKDQNSFIFSQNIYSTPDNDPANLLAIDCEMVNTGSGDDLELARISVVRCCRSIDLKTMKGIKQWLSLSKALAYEIIYDTFVKPQNKVIDYLTKYSGITESSLIGVETTLSDVHLFLKNLIKSDTILVGHSIQSDLKAMKIYHPYIIDTSTIYNISGDFTRKPGLKPLSSEILKQEIRKSGKKIGHDSIEDAQTALKLVIVKLSKDLNFGNKSRATYNPPNSMLGAWKDVSSPENSVKLKLENDINRTEQKTTYKCVLESNEAFNNIEDTADIQTTIDKFTLLKENPAVVKTTDLLFEMQIAIQIIVNSHGVVGQQQCNNMCQSIIKVLSDEDVVKQTIINSRKNDVLVSILSDFNRNNGHSDLEQQTNFSSIHQSIKNIVTNTPKKSAIFVIFPGTNGRESIGKFFWKIS